MKNSKKIGRNDPCPCGSGKKFKHCCLDKQGPPEAVRQMLARTAAEEFERKRQQGLGKPIISLEHAGRRFVAVGDRLYHSERWKTFHDFLLYYIRDVLAGDWANAELAKPAAERHPLMAWYHDVTVYLNARIKEPGKVHATNMTGMIAAYLGLAYNLYLVAHHQKLHASLVRRLKHRDQFYGAYYEAFVIGALLRAGFQIELEDESDSTTSHCELTATFRPTGEKFSVEAKMRGPNKQSADVGNQLYNALKKKADHPRIVFIEVNAAGDGTLEGQKKILHEVLTSIRNREGKLTIEGQPAPPAYIIATNNPHGSVVDCALEISAIAEGFKMPDFKMEAEYASLQEVVAAREKHAAITALLASLGEHRRIPVTFDGDLPEYKFGPGADRLLIGQRYEVETPGGLVSGVLDCADINVEGKYVTGIIRRDDGESMMVHLTLTDAQIAAYHAAPQTFFGILQPKRSIKTPLEAYDWIYESYRHNTKEHFLKLMAGAPDLEKLRELSQPELAKIYAERIAYSIMHQTGLGKPSSGS